MGKEGLNTSALLFNSVLDEYLIAPAELQCNGPSLQLKQWWERERLHRRSRLMGARLSFITMNHAFITSLQLGTDTEET